MLMAGVSVSMMVVMVTMCSFTSCSCSCVCLVDIDTDTGHLLDTGHHNACLSSQSSTQKFGENTKCPTKFVTVQSLPGHWTGTVLEIDPRGHFESALATQTWTHLK